MNWTQVERSLFYRLHRRAFTVALEIRSVEHPERNFNVREVTLKTRTAELAKLYAVEQARADRCDVRGVWVVVR